MLQFFRSSGRGLLGKVLLTGLAVAFVGWGITDYLVRNTGAAALTVGGTGVSVADIQRSYDAQVGTLTSMLGAKPTPEQLQQFGITENVLTEAINRVVLRQTASQLGFQASVSALRNEIASMPVFSTGGKFDPARYTQLVTQAGLSVADFEADLAKDLAVRSIAQLVKLPTPSPEALKPLTQLEDATTQLAVLTLTPSMVPAVVPTKAQIEDFYKANPTLFATDEKRSWVTLRLNPAELGQNLTISEDAIAAHYKDNQDQYQLPEQRTVHHILFENAEEATKVASTIKTFADFTAAAATHSLDTANKDTGGSLGNIVKTDVVPEFGNRAFSLPVGQLGGPVTSPFGSHLIWVTAILPPRAQTLAEVHDQLKAELTATEAEDTLQQLQDQLTDGLAAGTPLDKLAEKLGLKVTRSSLLTAQANTVPAPEVQAAFAGDLSTAPEPLTQPDGSLMWVQPTTIIPSEVPALDTIKADVTAKAAIALRQEALTKLANQLLAAQPNLTQAAQAAGLTATPSSVVVKDVTSAPAYLQPELLAISALPVGAKLTTPIVDENNLHLVQVTSRTPATLTPPQLQAAAGAYAKRLQSDVEAMLIGHLRQSTKIESNLTLLRQVFPDYTPAQE